MRPRFLRRLCQAPHLDSQQEVSGLYQGFRLERLYDYCLDLISMSLHLSETLQLSRYSIPVSLDHGWDLELAVSVALSTRALAGDAQSVTSGSCISALDQAITLQARTPPPLFHRSLPMLRALRESPDVTLQHNPLRG